MLVAQTERNYIEGLLNASGVTIQELARQADMSYSQTWDIVKNGYSEGTRIGNLEKIASVLRVPLMDVLDNHPRKQ